MESADFEAAYRNHAGAIERYFTRRLPPDLRDEAPDLAAATWLRAWSSRRTYGQRPGAPFLAWLYTVAHSVWADYWRWRGRHGHWTEELLPEVSARLSVPDRSDAEDSERIARVLDPLTAKQRQVLLMGLDGYSDTEIAAATGAANPLAIRMLRFRARTKLRAIGGRK